LEGSENAPTPLPLLKPLLGVLGADGVAGVLGWITIAPFDEPAAPAPGIEGAPDGVAVEPAPLTPRPPPTLELELPLDAAPPAVPVAFPAVPAAAPDETPVCAPAVRLSAAIPMPSSKSVEWIRCIIDLLWVRGRNAAHNFLFASLVPAENFSPKINAGDRRRQVLAMTSVTRRRHRFRRASPRTCSAMHSGCRAPATGGTRFFVTSG
jgi:hypothetical protein